MSVKSFFMSLSRLALVQVLHSGHPQTSGSKNMDYYITSKLKESEGSDEYYSERLIKMPRIPVNYSVPKIIKKCNKKCPTEMLKMFQT